MSLIKLIKKQLLYSTDESWSAFGNLSFNNGNKGGEIKGEKSRGEEHLNMETLAFWRQKRDMNGKKEGGR